MRGSFWLCGDIAIDIDRIFDEAVSQLQEQMHLLAERAGIARQQRPLDVCRLPGGNGHWKEVLRPKSAVSASAGVLAADLDLRAVLVADRQR